MAKVTADDFFAGLFAALIEKGQKTLSIRVDRFDPAIASVFGSLQEQAGKHGDLTIRFRVRPHPVHGDSMTVRNALAAAAQRDIISFDNPEYQDIRIKLSVDDAE